MSACEPWADPQAPGGDAVLAMEMWWRAAALEALHAYVLGPLAAAPKADQLKLGRSVAQLLRPTLDAIAANVVLQASEAAGR
jgi:predicted N-acetyltransferase YhbS